MKQQNIKLQSYKLFVLAEKKAKDKSYALLSSDEIMSALDLSPMQTSRLLSRLNSQGQIAQIQKKLYLLPGRLPPGKIWKPSPYLVLAIYMKWLNAKWQITGLDAFSRYGFSTQISQKIFLYNDKLSGEFVLAGSKFVFIKVPKRKLGSCQIYKIPQSDLKLYFSSKARTLFDAVYDYKRFGTLPNAYEWIARFAYDKKIINDLTRCVIKYGNKITAQRIGFMLDELGINNGDLLQIQKKMKTIKTLVTLMPGSRAGSINNNWKVVINFPIKKLVNHKG